MAIQRQIATLVTTDHPLASVGQSTTRKEEAFNTRIKSQETQLNKTNGNHNPNGSNMRSGMSNSCDTSTAHSSATTPEPAIKQDHIIFHHVSPADTLEGICVMYGVTVINKLTSEAYHHFD